MKVHASGSGSSNVGAGYIEVTPTSAIPACSLMPRPRGWGLGTYETNLPAARTYMQSCTHLVDQLNTSQGMKRCL